MKLFQDVAAFCPQGKQFHKRKKLPVLRDTPNARCLFLTLFLKGRFLAFRANPDDFACLPGM